MFIAAAILTSFAVFGGGLVVFTYTHTKDIIAANERAALLANLSALVPVNRYDNALTQDSIVISDPTFFGTQEPITVYRAYQNGQPVAILATLIAPDGYSGPIKLLVGVYANGTLAGVRVLAHQETPGLGDAIETARSDWIHVFAGKSLTNPKLTNWAVKKDGGAFDQFTGATITPRAVVKAIRRFLVYFQSHQQQLFHPKRTTLGEKL
jgi:electron transport complex protein RnfG